MRILYTLYVMSAPAAPAQDFIHYTSYLVLYLQLGALEEVEQRQRGQIEDEAWQRAQLILVRDARELPRELGVHLS